MRLICSGRLAAASLFLATAFLLLQERPTALAQKGTPQKGTPKKGTPKKGTRPPSPHYQLQPGEFPPPGTARAIGGELIAIDRVNRTGMFRLDRTDAQSRAHFDLPIAFTMLPYGSLAYHGAPAELRDIPLGTHLIGQFYWDDDRAYDPQIKDLIAERRLHPDSGFHWVLRFEDDFSHDRRQGRAWRIDAIDLEKKTLTATNVGPKGEPANAKPEIFQINDALRVFKGNGFGSLDDLHVGQHVLMNFTFRTMRLSGRITDIWLDEASQALAAARQLAVHRLYQREHGLAGWIDAVDDKARRLTVTLFDGFDPKLKDDFKTRVLLKEVLVPPYVAVAVAENSLRAYDPVNDIKRAPILEFRDVPIVPGCSGWQIVCQPDLMLEGFRTKRIVRLYAGSWGVTDLPREEKLFP
jgi:hypothetical protein